MTTIPATQGVIADSGNFDITSTPTDIAVKGPESYLLLYLPDPGSTAFEISVSVQYAAGGDFMPAMLLPVAPLATIPSTNSKASQAFDSGPSKILVGGATADDDRTNRVWMIPCFGADAVRFSRPSSTLTNCRVKHIVGPMPYVNALTRPQRSIQLTYSDVTGSASYADGDVIGGTLAVSPNPDIGALAGNGIIPKLRQITLTDYALGYGDLDIVIVPAGSQSTIVDSGAFNLTAPEIVSGWLEFRASPTGSQLPIRNGGASGGNMYVAGPLDIDVPYGDGGDWFDLLIVSREALTPDAGGGALTTVVEI